MGDKMKALQALQLMIQLKRLSSNYCISPAGFQQQRVLQWVGPPARWKSHDDVAQRRLSAVFEVSTVSRAAAYYGGKLPTGESADKWAKVFIQARVKEWADKKTTAFLFVERALL